MEDIKNEIPNSLYKAREYVLSAILPVIGYHKETNNEEGIKCVIDVLLGCYSTRFSLLNETRVAQIWTEILANPLKYDFVYAITTRIVAQLRSSDYEFDLEDYIRGHVETMCLARMQPTASISDKSQDKELYFPDAIEEQELGDLFVDNVWLFCLYYMQFSGVLPVDIVKTHNRAITNG